MIRAIFWDNDGVLVDTEELYFDATRKMLAQVDVDLTRQLYIDLSLVQAGGAWYLAEAKGVSPETIEQLRNERNALYAHALEETDVALPGVEAVLRGLTGHLPLAVVTCSRRDHFEIIHRRTGFLKYFNFCITADDFENTKPHPEPYLKAVARSGFRAAECLAIEDSERGLRSAKAAGISCWVVPTALTERSNFSAADRVLHSISEVSALLLKF